MNLSKYESEIRIYRQFGIAIGRKNAITYGWQCRTTDEINPKRSCSWTGFIPHAVEIDVRHLKTPDALTRCVNPGRAKYI